MVRVFVLVVCLALAANFSALPANGGDIQTPLEQLAKGDWIMQTQAIEELARMGDKSSVPAIRQLLNNRQTSVYVRRRALVALVRLDRGAAARDVKALAGDNDPRLRAAAAEAYGCGDASVAKAPLGNLLKDKDQKVATAAVVSWAKLYGKDGWAVVDPATQALANHKLSADLTWKLIPAMLALAHTGCPEAHARIDTVYKAMARSRDRSELVLRGLVTSGETSALVIALRYAYRHNTEKRKPDGLPRGPLHIPNDPVYLGITTAIRRHGPEVVEKTVRTLAQSQETKDLELACVLGAQLTPSPKTGDLLLKACGESQDIYVGHTCAGALMQPAMQPARYQAYFTKLLKSKHAALRIIAIDALALCPDVNRYQAYSGIVEKGDEPEVLVAALEQLVSAPGKHVPKQRIGAYLTNAMVDKHVKVRNAAVALFKQAASKRDYPSVARDWESMVYGKNLQVRQTARQAIASIAPEDVQTELARNDGYLTQWRVLGTFLGGETLEKTPAYPPETEIDFDKTYQADGIFITRRKKSDPPIPKKRTRTVAWRKGSVTAVNGLLRVNYFVSPPTRKTVAYAVATVTPKTPGRAIIWVEGVARQQLWFNGAKVTAPKPQAPSPKDRYLWPQKYIWNAGRFGSGATRAIYKVTLKPGPNQILIKSLNIKAPEWEFRVRVLGIDGSPLEMQQ